MEEIREHPINNGRETFTEAGEAAEAVGLDRKYNSVSSAWQWEELL